MFITVIIGVFFTIRVLERKKVKFTTRTIYATVIGLVLGLIIQAVAGFPDNPSEITWLNEISKWYSLVGSGFMDLLKIVIYSVEYEQPEAAAKGWFKLPQN